MKNFPPDRQPRAQRRGGRSVPTAWMVTTCLAVASSGAAAVHAAQPSPSAERPNVILILTDDQGYGDFGATGNRLFETPAIDGLAAESASLSTFYVCPVCSPTRASLMTGRWHYRTRIVDTFRGRSMMDPAEVTLAEVLSQAGYRTGIFGKWHLGDCYPLRPIDQGFQESLILRGGGLAQPSEPLENNERYTDPILFHNGEQVATKGYCTDVYFDAALEFLAASVAGGTPFFVYIPTNAPHGPLHDVPQSLLEHYRSMDLQPLLGDEMPADRVPAATDQLARIAAMITNIDQNVGRLLARLSQLGVADNTIVVFLVDNGPNTRRCVGPFRGMKSEVYEGGVRSPCWLRWPHRWQAGTAVDLPTAHIDLMPTLLEACRVSPPEPLALDGRSLVRLLDGQPADWPQRSIVLQAHRGDVPQAEHHFMIRQGRWKLVRNSGFGKEEAPPGAPLELYDLQNDPGETNNLADQHPDRLAAMREDYRAWFADVSHTRPDNYAPPRIVVAPDNEKQLTLTWQDRRGAAWNANEVGVWLLDVQQPGAYDMRIILRQPVEADTVSLRLGAQRISLPLPAGATEVTMSRVELPAGPIELAAQAELSAAAERPLAGAYQVVVSPSASSRRQ